VDWRRELLQDAIVSLIYTGVIVILIKSGLLKPLAGYLANQ
jgi:hypothetical protein